MQFDKWTYTIGAAAIAVAVVLGALAGAWPGVLAALAGLGSAALWEAAADRRKKVQAGRNLLQDADRQLAPPEVESGGSAKYLRPEAAVVSFWPRPELAALRDWLVSSQHADVQLLTGEGGAGKTRLALQLGEEAAEQYGYRTYWVAAGSEEQAARAAQQGQTPSLLIIDYAETRTNLQGLLAEAVGAGRGPNVRVLLLARSAGEWWQQLIASPGPC